MDHLVPQSCSAAPDVRPMDTTKPGEAALLDQLLLSRAATLARAGSRQAAADLIEAAIAGGEGRPPALDLLARIRAQQGEWLEAERLWLEVSRQQPGHAGAAAGLARLRRGRGRWKSGGQWMAVSLALTAVVLVWAAFQSQRVLVQEQQRALAALQARQTEVERAQAQRDDAHRRALDSAIVTLNSVVSGQQAAGARLSALTEGQQTAAARLSALTEGQQTLARRLGETETRWRGAVMALDRSAAAAVPLHLPFEVPGVRSATQGTSLVVWFEAELFEPEGRLVADARARVRNLARAIAMMQERLVVDVTALETIEARPTAAVAVSAQRRAELAASTLRRTGLFPRQSISPQARPPQEGDPEGVGLVFRLRRVLRSVPTN